MKPLSKIQVRNIVSGYLQLNLPVEDIINHTATVIQGALCISGDGSTVFFDGKNDLDNITLHNVSDVMVEYNEFEIRFIEQDKL